MTSNQKFELTQLGKDKEIKVESRILLENKELSNIENAPYTENMIIHEDNETGYLSSILLSLID